MWRLAPSAVSIGRNGAAFIGMTGASDPDMADADTLPAERIERAILLIRGQKVMLDRDLAQLYGVATFNLNKAVRRNRRRFPDDFMFQLTAEEAAAL
jgi:hypothetical protein